MQVKFGQAIRKYRTKQEIQIQIASQTRNLGRPLVFLKFTSITIYNYIPSR